MTEGYIILLISTVVLSRSANGFLAPPGEPKGIARFVIQLIDEPKLALKMGQAGLQRVEEFGAKRMVAQISDLYRQLIMEKGL